MTDSALTLAIRLIEQKPHDGQSLLLYALIKTLSSPNGQHLFLLNKLGDMSSERRQLAYGLMELMVAGENQSEAWQSAVERMEAALRG